MIRTSVTGCVGAKRPPLWSPIARIFLSPITRLSRASTEEMSDFVATRRFHGLRFSPDRWTKHWCSGRCLRSAASHGACGCATESLHAVPHERLDGFFSWNECWCVAGLSHPAFCSARERTAQAALSGGGMLWMWSRVSPFGSILFTWRCSRVFVLPSFQKSRPR